MGALAVIGTLGPVAKVLLKTLELIDPKTRNWVNQRKALDFGEKYILADKELMYLTSLQKPSKREKKRISYLKRRKNYLGKWYFDYN